MKAHVTFLIYIITLAAPLALAANDGFVASGNRVLRFRNERPIKANNQEEWLKKLTEDIETFSKTNPAAWVQQKRKKENRVNIPFDVAVNLASFGVGIFLLVDFIQGLKALRLAKKDLNQIKKLIALQPTKENREALLKAHTKKKSAATRCQWDAAVSIIFNLLALGRGYNLAVVLAARDEVDRHILAYRPERV